MVVVRLFAGLRERAGAKSIVLDLWPGASVADALASDALRELRADTVCLMAVNRRYANEDQVLRPGDELALVPPVSGGSDAIQGAVGARAGTRAGTVLGVRGG